MNTPERPRKTLGLIAGRVPTNSAAKKPETTPFPQAFEINDFYSKLLLYQVLHPFHGAHIERQFKQDASKPTFTELRRSFLDNIAYLCDIKKGGTVTAAALQKLPLSNFLWLASNETMAPNVVDIIKDILLVKLKGVNTKDRETLEKSILQDAVHLASQRIEFYRAKMIEVCKECRVHLKAELPDVEAMGLRKWLRTVRNKKGCQLVQMCYDSRGKELGKLKKKSSESNSYRELAHYIGRLGAHQCAVSTIFSAVSKVPSLQQIMDVRVEPSSEAQEIVLPDESLHPYETVKEISRNTSSLDDLQSFVVIDSRRHLRHEMQKKRKIVTVVHAELLLVDLFSRRAYEFVDKDNYVGCSKPACYFCYHWIRMHHKNFVLPASHGKIILGCRGPDVDPKLDTNGNGAKFRQKMCHKMVKQFQDDIMGRMSRLGQENRRISFEHCSSGGTSRAPSVSVFNSGLRQRM